MTKTLYQKAGGLELRMRKIIYRCGLLTELLIAVSMKVILFQMDGTVE